MVAKNKTLYEVLEVARNASPDTIEAAYRTLAGRLNARADAAAKVQRMAVEDAYRTLSHPELRRRYDAKLLGSPVPLGVAVGIDDERPWFMRHAVWLLAAAALAAAGYGYYRSVEKERERIAIARALQEKEEALARHKAEEEERARQRAEAEAQRHRRLEEIRLQQWVEQTRRESASYASRQQYEERSAQREAERQRRMEEMQKQREEAEARARLEQEKRKLQRLEAENYGYRRY